MGGAPNSPCASTSQPAAREHVVPRRRERREVRHLAARDEADAPVAGQAERDRAATPRPTSSTTADERREHVDAAFWSQAETSQSAAVGRRQAAADDEAEVARALRGDGAGCRPRRRGDRSPQSRSRRRPAAARRRQAAARSAARSAVGAHGASGHGCRGSVRACARRRSSGDTFSGTVVGIHTEYYL